MNLRKYIFLTGLICFAWSMTHSSCVMASTAVFDEIDKFVSPTEEIQFEKPVQQELSEEQPKDIEEQPVEKETKPTKKEVKIQNTKTSEKQTDTTKKQNEAPKQKDLSETTPLPTPENNSVETVPSEQPEIEKKPQKHCLSLSKFFNKCRNFFSRLSFDKIIELKETITKHFSSKKSNHTPCCRQIIEHKKIIIKKDFVPYYFLYPESIDNIFEKIFTPNKITNHKELLPYSYLIENCEVKKLEAPKNAVTPQGTEDIRVLINAPSPKIEVTGKSLYAKIVIDIGNNTLYKYDEDGFPLKAYLVATGARGTRTKPGLRIVTYKEKFPYQGAPINTKRITDPYSYGPFIIFFNVVNTKTGKHSYVDQFLHGNGNEHSIGRKVSHGCVRTNNKVMREELSKEVNRGDYVLLINPDTN